MLCWVSMESVDLDAEEKEFIRFLFGDEDVGAMIDDESFGEYITGLATPRFDEYLLDENSSPDGSDSSGSSMSTDFSRQEDRKGRPRIDARLLILGCLRIISKGTTYDLVDEATDVSYQLVGDFFIKHFLKWFVDSNFKKWRTNDLLLMRFCSHPRQLTPRLLPFFGMFHILFVDH